MLSPSASSSAVTIPTPGKSILKRPPPPQQSFFSLARLSKLLPTQNQTAAANDEASTLKRAHFILPEMTTVYPILASNPPCTPLLKEEKRSIEEREAERRRRIVRGSNASTDSYADDDWWSIEKVEGFYRECCIGREEPVDPAISAAFKRGGGAHPRTVDFSGIQLNVGVASVLSDVFTIEWGLRKLVFKECDLDEHILKPMLHALLIPNTLTFLSVASNRRLKGPAFRLIGAYVTKARSLQFLDLSQNTLDKKAIEYIAAALPEAPSSSGLISLRLDDCALKPQALDVLAHAVRKSSLRNISLRHNRISATGAVAIALMIKDYPDRFPGTNEGSAPPSPATSTSSLGTFYSPPATPVVPTRTLPGANGTNGTITPPAKAGPILPPPRHPAATPQTTYTPYIPRSRRGASAAGVPTPGHTNPLSPAGRPIPIIASSAQGGITARHPVPPPPPAHPNGTARGVDASLKHGPSAALLEQVRALDNLPRLGALQTLDLKGNDIRTGITYIAQVLKRNRTLKVLNLSENKLDVMGLTAIAEALKYNSCLETLDLSKNPCCGPGLEGIQSLRTAFTLNNALKRLFLSSTSMTSAGAIALAEFLPESASLLHLDLTMNNLDLAGVMALSSGLKANHVMRCLDLNIPPADEEMARMCRDILESCVRNTEEAEKAAQGGSSGRGEAKGVWGMIEQSELAKSIREDDKKKVDEQIDIPSPRSRSPTDIPSLAEQTDSDFVSQVRARKSQLEEVLSRASSPPSSSSGSTSPPVKPDFGLIESTREMTKSLVVMIEKTTDPSRLESLLALNDDLMALLGRLEPKPEGLKLQGLGIEAGEVLGNGHACHASDSSDSTMLTAEEGSEDEDEPLTPRIDKGKGRAEPEPEPVESILSPSYVITGSDDEDGEVAAIAPDLSDLVSPTDLSRKLVEEEGEVFRKGAVLLTPEEMEGEYAGDELRRELLEAMVERPPPRMVDEYGAESVPQDSTSPAPEEPPKPAPRPYIRRTRSSSSTLSVDGQGSGSGVSPVIEKSHSLPGSATASPISPAVSRLPSLGRRASASSILEADEPPS
ncbi:RNI-like protein [Lentinus brumalis]|uniref:RNI-like protein n=1 Tax=Lentinus brumalis TaxID=2498619 RepID=A0A371DPS7_9APHY|nr:RNI-like protein [Polyporus brumalis]